MPLWLSTATGFPSGAGVGERVEIEWFGAREPRPRACELVGAPAIV